MPAVTIYKFAEEFRSDGSVTISSKEFQADEKAKTYRFDHGFPLSIPKEIMGTFLPSFAAELGPILYSLDPSDVALFAKQLLHFHEARVRTAEESLSREKQRLLSCEAVAKTILLPIQKPNKAKD